jgi:hypothetical protein
MTVNCEEWGQGHKNDVVLLPTGEDLFFPHVDSCLAIIFIRLRPVERVVGGHAAVSSEKGAFGFTESLGEMLDRMREQAGGSPDIAVFIGDIAANDVNRWPVTAVLQSKATHFANTQIIPFVYRVPLDVWYNGGTYTVKIADWNANHDGAVLEEQPVYTARRKSHAGACCCVIL